MVEHARLPLWSDSSSPQQLDILHRLLLDLYHYTYRDAFQQMERTLSQFQPFDEQERRDVETIHRLMEQHPNIFLKNCEVAHFTGSALVTHVESGRFLLHYHKKLGKWLQFGGHPELETDMLQVALRESTEETGLPDLKIFPQTSSEVPVDIEVQTIPEHKGLPQHLHLDLRYLVSTHHPELLNTENPDESNTFKWFAFDTTDSLPENIDPALERLILKAKNHYYKVRRDT